MADTTLSVIEAQTGGTPLAAIDFMQAGTLVKAGKQHLVDASGAPLFSAANPAMVRAISVDQAVTAIGASGAAVTLTLPAPGAGLFQFIDVIEVQLYSAAARTGAAAPITVTTTNLPGPMAWYLDTAGAVGTSVRYAYSGNRPLRAAAANTPVTIVAPAVTGGIWRLTASYSTGP